MQTCDQTNQTAEYPISLFPHYSVRADWDILFTFSSYFDQSRLQHDNTNNQKKNNR